MILLGAAMVSEIYLARHIWSPITPDGVQTPSLGTLPILAVQVTASLLGFYLASVSIVLGNSYRDASADIRELVLGSPKVRRNLAWVGAAIGGGLFLVLLQGLEFQYGYLTISIYILIIVFSGWAFVNLAYGAFSLFDPTELSIEPLIGLSRAIVKGGEKVCHCGGGIVYHRHDEKGLNWEPGGIRSGAGVRSSGVSQESTGSSDTWEAALCRLCLRR